MNTWTIVPRDPLIFRDGRPFTTDGGARARTLPFPFPSTLAGAVRTMAGPDEKGEFSKERIRQLLEMGICGPLLVELDDDMIVADWLLPAPADALLLKDAQDPGAAIRLAMVPLQPPAGAQTDMGDHPVVGPVDPVKGKPHKKAPRYWRREQYWRWLLQAAPDTVALNDLGVSGPVQELRTHVSIDPQTGTALEGALFQTSGLEFTQIPVHEDGKPVLTQARQLGLALGTDAPLHETLGFVGGERRTAAWKEQQADLLGCSTCPEGIQKRIREQRACRLILLTPAYFREGYQPSWLLEKKDVELVASVNQRYQVVSGWSYEHRRPKPTRRLVPAGSVCFLRLGSGVDIEEFIESTWLQNISDEQQDRMDGFGLAVLGTWDGKLKQMEVRE